MSNLIFSSRHSWYENYLVRGVGVYETTSYISAVLMILNTLHSAKRFLNHKCCDTSLSVTLWLISTTS